MGTVKIIYGNDPFSMVHSLIEKSSSLDSLNKDDTVFIKPNLVVSRPNWHGVDTDPRVVEALVIELKERGIHRITVGDGSGGGQSASIALDYCGYREMAKHYGLKLLDLEKGRFDKIKVPVNGPFKTLEIARPVLESDFFINVPIMKAHMAVLITCSLKNLKGTMPRHMKRRFHGTDLQMAITQLNSVLAPDLIVVDGLQGDLNYETGNTPVAMDRILLGTNPVEVDSVVADMLGYKPRDIRYIAHSADAGLGECDLGRIEILPLNKPLKDEKYLPPPHYTGRFSCQISAEGVCCTCMGNLMFALERLSDERMLSRRLHFLIGQMAQDTDSTGSIKIAVGQCAVKNHTSDAALNKCPPSANEIYQEVENLLKSRDLY
jgi:uncharacterized protein (DUF362 family)